MFSKIKTIFDKIMLEALQKQDKTIVGKYMKMLKENKIFSTQYLVYENIENYYTDNQILASSYVTENVSFIKAFNVINVANENDKILKGLPKNTEMLEINPIYESIDKLVTMEKNMHNLHSLLKEENIITSHIINNKKIEESTQWNVDDPIAIVNILANNFNNKYSMLDEADKSYINEIIFAEDKEEKFCDTKKKLLEKINGLLQNKVTTEEKEKVLAVKEKLLDMNYDNSSYITDIHKMSTLKESI